MRLYFPISVRGIDHELIQSSEAAGTTSLTFDMAKAISPPLLTLEYYVRLGFKYLRDQFLD